MEYISDIAGSCWMLHRGSQHIRWQLDTLHKWERARKHTGKREWNIFHAEYRRVCEYVANIKCIQVCIKYTQEIRWMQKMAKSDLNTIRKSNRGRQFSKISTCTLHKHTHAHTYRFESYSNTCICSLWSLYRLSYVSNLHCALSIQLLDFAWFLNWCLQIRFRHALTAHSTQSHRYSNSTYLHLYGIYIPICNYSYAVSVCVCEWKCVSFSFSLLTSWPIA